MNKGLTTKCLRMLGMVIALNLDFVEDIISKADVNSFESCVDESKAYPEPT